MSRGARVRPMTAAEWEAAVLRLARRAGRAHDAWFVALGRLRPEVRKGYAARALAVEIASAAHDAAIKDMGEAMIGLWLRRREGLGKRT